jgi:penicillin-binding protein 2
VRFQPRLQIGTEDSESRDVDWVTPVTLPGVDGSETEHGENIEAAMVGVPSEQRGTAQAAMRGAPYTLAGKTGSAQVFTIAQEEEYDEETVDERLRDHGLFFAYAPVEAPRIALAVVVANGGGSRAATPIARQILDAYFETEGYVARHR